MNINKLIASIVLFLTLVTVGFISLISAVIPELSIFGCVLLYVMCILTCIIIFREQRRVKKAGKKGMAEVWVERTTYRLTLVIIVLLGSIWINAQVMNGILVIALIITVAVASIMHAIDLEIEEELRSNNYKD